MVKILLISHDNKIECPKSRLVLLTRLDYDPSLWYESSKADHYTIPVATYSVPLSDSNFASMAWNPGQCCAIVMTCRGSHSDPTDI